LAPQAVTAPDRIEQISLNVDRIASDVIASKEQMTRSIDHLAADHEQMTRKIINLQTLPQYIFYGSRETLTKAASSSAKGHSRRFG
jgi:hypothetical protein